DNIIELQKQFSLTSLSNWEKGILNQADVPDSITLSTRPNYTGPLAYFYTMADLMIENLPTEEHAAEVESFKYIGLFPGKKFKPETLSEPIKVGLARAAVAGEQIIQWKQKYNGELYPSRWNNVQEGTYGADYLGRAVGAQSGLLVHDYEEAVYFSTYESYDEATGRGEFLNSSNKYVLHIDADQFLKTEDLGFWSITMYGPNYKFVDNDLDRYALSGDSDTLQYNEDGSLDIYMQSEAPTSEKQGNWLPCPKETEQLFRVSLRAYLPTSYTLTHRQQFTPPILKISD
ncbi:MAG: DUF1254 domain-containing protein, partial [Symploca sp. SIO2E6]|nr:DUF1254 domain-containing protein [Symploca sp. SIO2E6]